MKRILAIFLSIMMILPLCVVFSASAAESTVVYIDDINCYGTSNIGPILLYGEGKTASNFGVSAHGWWHKVVLTFNAMDGSFVVKQTCFHTSSTADSSYTSVTLGANDVMILVHDTYADFHAAIGALAVGDKLYAYGFDFTNATASDKLSNGTSDVYFTTYTPSMGDDYYGYVEPTEPEEPETEDSNVESLGAKVNTEKYGLRLGATFTRDNTRGEVLSLGMLVISEKALGSDELNLEYAASNSAVADVKARTIENYVDGQEFEDYETITYYVTVLGLKNYTSENIVARPYVTYRTNSDIVTYYGETMVKNYNDVAAAAGGSTTPSEPDDDITTPTEPETGTTASGHITSVNYYQWVDSAPLANHIYAYASNTSAQTPLSINGNNVLFSTSNGIVFQYNSTTGKYTVITVDFDTTDGVNAAETQTLSDGILVVMFAEDAASGQADSYSFYKNNVVVGAEFYLSTELSYIQYGMGATGSVSNLYFSLTPIEEEEEESAPTISDTSVGTIASTVGTYTSNGSSTASSGDTDGLSCVLYAPQNNTLGISTYVNLSAISTTLYTSDEALAKQKLGVGIATDKNIDNAYMYLCLNSTNWSGDFGLIKRLGDADWEIVTSESYYNTWRWNAYSWSSDVTVYYDSDYVYSMWNVMDGREALYIKDSYKVKDLQMNLMYSSGTLTFSLTIGGTTIFSVSDTGTVSNGKYGRAASITNSSSSSYGTSNYLYQISSTKNGRDPAALSNVQFYNTYYYTSSGSKKLTISSGSLWLYPSRSSSAGYLTNSNGDPIVTCKEVTLTDGTTMDIIDIENY